MISVEKQYNSITNSEVYVENDKRITLPILNDFEVVNIINARCTILSESDNPKIYIDVKTLPEHLRSDSASIAKKELLENKLPFIIKRPIDSNVYELWSLIDDNMKVVNLEIE